MYSSTSFVMQVANLFIEICGFNDEDCAGLQDLKRLFRYHEVNRDATTVHRVVVCKYDQFEISHEATLDWVLSCVGGDRPKHHRRLFFIRKKEVPHYSGAGDVRCYKDLLRQVEYLVPENAEWRIKHIAKEHVTYVFFDRCDEKFNLIPLLIHVVGSQYGCYLLFASSVAIEGKALLFTGNSGVGKTPLCMELMKQGASYVGDDLVLVYTNEGQAMAGSLLFPMKYYSNGIYSHKKMIDVVAESAHPHLNAPLASIYFLQNAENAKSESCIKPMPSEIMFEKMLGLTNKVNTNADGRHFFNTISSICDSVPCYCLTYSNRNKLNTLFFANNDQR